MNSNMALLESYFTKGDGKAYKRYHALSESEQKVVSKDAISKLFQSVKTKALKVNYMGIEASKGDITKFSKYEDIANSIRILENMSKSDPSNAPKEINTVIRTLDVLKKYKTDFESAFENNNELVIITYTNIVAALIGGTSMLVSATIDYIKDPMGNYKAIFKNKKAVTDDVYLKSLDKFLSMELKGDLKQLFKANLSESCSFLNEDGLQLREDLAVGFIVLAVLFLIIFIIRDIVFIYYFAGAKLAESLMTLAYFLEQNAYGLDTSNRKGKKVFDKQMNVVEKLRHLADRIVASNKDATKRASKEKDKEDSDNSSISGGSVLV